eukprot:SAG31_NODE_1186_length_9492_cov_70.124987_8_plen_83_part_00
MHVARACLCRHSCELEEAFFVVVFQKKQVYFLIKISTCTASKATSWATRLAKLIMIISSYGCTCCLFFFFFFFFFHSKDPLY